MNLNPFSFICTRRVTIDEEYGDVISKENAPVFVAWGLGEEGVLPRDTYSQLQEFAFESALALYHFAGVEPGHTFGALHWLEFVPIDNRDIARAMFRAAFPEYHEYPFDPETDIVMAVVHKGTKELLCYYFYVKGDGTSALFTLAPHA